MFQDEEAVQGARGDNADKPGNPGPVSGLPDGGGSQRCHPLHAGSYDQGRHPTGGPGHRESPTGSPNQRPYGATWQEED